MSWPACDIWRRISAWRSAMMPETIIVALTPARANVSSTRKMPRRWPYSTRPMALGSGTADSNGLPVGLMSGAAQCCSDQPWNAQRKNTAKRFPPGQRKSGGNGTSVAAG